MDLRELRQRQAKAAGHVELEHAGAERGARARRGAAARRDEHRQSEHGSGLGAAGGALGGELRAEGERELGEHEHGEREHRRQRSQLDRGLPGLAADHRSTASTVRLGRGSRRGTCSVTATVPSAPTRTRDARAPALAGARLAPRHPVAHRGRRLGRRRSRRARPRWRRERTGTPARARPRATAGTAATPRAPPQPVLAPPPCQEARSGLRHESVAKRDR